MGLYRIFRMKIHFKYQTLDWYETFACLINITFNPCYSAPSKNLVLRFFFKFLSFSPLWVLGKKNFNLVPKLTTFFYPVPVQANLLSGTNIFSLKNFFLFWIQKIKENFISFRSIFQKNKKRLNWSNNIVKTKNS
jgi:hypothetical protein